MEDTHSHHLGLFLDEDWNRHDSEQSFGHDIEASWLLMETVLLQRQALVGSGRVRNRADLPQSFPRHRECSDDGCTDVGLHKAKYSGL